MPLFSSIQPVQPDNVVRYTDLTVICNLTNTDKNQRVVDYISGGVYALGGRVEPTPVKTTFVCTPKSVNLVVENQEIEQMGTKVSAL